MENKRYVIRFENFGRFNENRNKIFSEPSSMPTTINYLTSEGYYKENFLNEVPTYLLDFDKEFESCTKVEFFLYSPEFLKKNPNILKKRFGKIYFIDSNIDINAVKETEIRFYYNKIPKNVKKINFYELKNEEIIKSILFNNELKKILQKMCQLNKPDIEKETDGQSIIYLGDPFDDNFRELSTNKKIKQYYKKMHLLAEEYDNLIVKLVKKLAKEKNQKEEDIK